MKDKFYSKKHFEDGTSSKLINFDFAEVKYNSSFLANLNTELPYDTGFNFKHHTNSKTLQLLSSSHLMNEIMGNSIDCFFEEGHYIDEETLPSIQYKSEFSNSYHDFQSNHLLNFEFQSNTILPNDLRKDLNFINRCSDEIEPNKEKCEIDYEVLKTGVKVKKIKDDHVQINNHARADDQNSLITHISSPKNAKLQISKVEKSKKIKKKIAKDKCPTKRLSERLKNMVKNYGKQCVIFAINTSEELLEEKGLIKKEIPQFKNYYKNNISGITNIESFRKLLLATENDSLEIIKFKKVFQSVSIIFIMNFSMQWIFASARIKDRHGHLFARFKMLRRVQNPENFTYIH